MILKIPFIDYKISINIYNIPKTDIIGMTTLCDGNRHVIFIDYDELSINDVKEDVAYLQNRFCLNNCYIIESSENHYHAIFIDKVSYNIYLEILKNSACDIEFYNSRCKIIQNKKSGVLRISKKGDSFSPRVVSVIVNNEKNNNSLSRKHYNMLKILSSNSDLKVDNLLLDDSVDIEIMKYRTFC